MLPVPDGSLADIGQHGLAHYPAGPAHDGVADAVRCEELAPGVAVQRILVIQQAPGVVEAAEAVWLQGGGYASALNINSRTQILQSLISLYPILSQNISQNTNLPSDSTDSETSPAQTDH